MKRICLIEHRQELSLCDTLRNAGHLVMAFQSASEALEGMLAEPADLVILEVRLPDREAIEALLAVREAFSHLPVLMLVAEPHPLGSSSVALALRLGADAALRAPFSREDLNDAVTRLLNQCSLAVAMA